MIESNAVSAVPDLSLETQALLEQAQIYLTASQQDLTEDDLERLFDQVADRISNLIETDDPNGVLACAMRQRTLAGAMITTTAWSLVEEVTLVEETSQTALTQRLFVVPLVIMSEHPIDQTSLDDPDLLNAFVRTFKKSRLVRDDATVWVAPRLLSDLDMAALTPRRLRDMGSVGLDRVMAGLGHLADAPGLHNPIWDAPLGGPVPAQPVDENLLCLRFLIGGVFDVDDRAHDLLTLPASSKDEQQRERRLVKWAKMAAEPLETMLNAPSVLCNAPLDMAMAGIEGRTMLHLVGFSCNFEHHLNQNGLQAEEVTARVRFAAQPQAFHAGPNPDPLLVEELTIDLYHADDRPLFSYVWPNPGVDESWIDEVLEEVKSLGVRMDLAMTPGSSLAHHGVDPDLDDDTRLAAHRGTVTNDLHAIAREFKLDEDIRHRLAPGSSRLQ